MVQFSNAQQTEDDEVWGAFGGRSIPTIKFTREDPPGSGNKVSMPIGTVFEGITTEPPQKRPAMKYGKPDEPDLWPNGQPKYNIIQVVQTEGLADPNDDEDDGQRRFFFDGSLRRAMQDEMREKKITRYGIGTKIRVELVGFKPNGTDRQPTKLFKVTMTPTEYVSDAQAGVDAVLAAGGQEVDQQGWAKQGPPAQQAPAQQAPAAQAQAPAEPTLDPTVQKAVENVELLIANGFARDTALDAAVAKFKGDATFRKLVEENTPI